MNILHICLASHYTEGMTYQDNQLAEQNAIDGHCVTVISDTNKYENGLLVPTGKQDIILENGVRLIRMPYLRLLGRFLGSKLIAVNGLYNLIEKIAPDVILYHGAGGLALLAAVKYKKRCPNIKLYIDSHAEYANSATTWLSKVFQYKLFHAKITRYAYQYIEKLFYISDDSLIFFNDLYALPKKKLEFYPLGGCPVEPQRKAGIRETVRADLGLADNDILLCHTGKLDEKKRTKELLEALSNIKSDNLKLIIIGSLSDNIKNDVMKLITKDDRVRFLGWKSGDELLDYLCATDLYIQPGDPSATLQNAMCRGVPIMVKHQKGYDFLLKDNGWFASEVAEMTSIFNRIATNPELLKTMGENSYKLAYDLLDYHKLAARLYE